MALRVSIGALSLIAMLLARRRFAHTVATIKKRALPLLIVGVLNSGAPFCLFAFAELTLSAGATSVINATTPLWGALVAWLWLKDRLTTTRTIGMAIGFAGVFVLVWNQIATPHDGSTSPIGAGLLAAAAALLASALYGVAGNFAKKYLMDVDPMTNAAGSMIGATLVLTPIMLLTWPSAPVSAHAWEAVLALGRLHGRGVFHLLPLDHRGLPLPRDDRHLRHSAVRHSVGRALSARARVARHARRLRGRVARHSVRHRRAQPVAVFDAAQAHFSFALFDSGGAMKAFLAKAKHEMMKMVPPALFFFVILHAVVIIRALMVKGTGISLPTSVSVIVASLILGKAVLIANMLPFINRFPERPLIWNAAWKTLIYSIIASIFHYLERLFDFWKETHSLAAAHTHINWPQFWAIQILLYLLIGNYCIFAELARVIGPGHAEDADLRTVLDRRARNYDFRRKAMMPAVTISVSIERNWKALYDAITITPSRVTRLSARSSKRALMCPGSDDARMSKRR